MTRRASIGIMPAIVDRSPLLVAIGTSGQSPTLARRVRAQLEAMLPERLGELARLAGAARERVQRALPDIDRRRRFWDRLFAGSIASKVFAGSTREAAALLDARAARRQPMASQRPRGEVYLIGAGPGDPDLLTLRALQLLQQSDVVLYDRLVSEAVLERVRRDAARIYRRQGVGPAPRDAGAHSCVAARVRRPRTARGAPQGRRSFHLRPRRRGARCCCSAPAFR